jgi:hypothetical protein
MIVLQDIFLSQARFEGVKLAARVNLRPVFALIGLDRNY